MSVRVNSKVVHQKSHTKLEVNGISIFFMYFFRGHITKSRFNIETTHDNNTCDATKSRRFGARFTCRFLASGRYSGEFLHTSQK